MRLTVNLDDETDTALEELVQEQGISKSEIVREAIAYYQTICQEWQRVDHDLFEWYGRLLGSGEHRIFDIEHTEALLNELGDPSAELLTEWERIGHKHGIEWDSQFYDLEQKLRVLEYCNWYSLTKISDTEYALTTQSPQEAQLMCEFLKGECAELGLNADFQQVDRKILATEQ